MTRSAGLYSYSSPVMRAFVGAADIDGEDMTMVWVEGGECSSLPPSAPRSAGPSSRLVNCGVNGV